MEYNKLQNSLQDYIDYYSASGIESIKWHEYNKLENTYRNNYLTQELKERAKYLHKWMHNIGKGVYHSNRNFNYALVDNFETDVDFFNKKYFDTTCFSIFTREMFDELCVKYCEYQVQRLTEELTERSITSNSTSKISNLVFEWNLECKQELIKIFKKLIDV
jgi:hypothetical protein